MKLTNYAALCLLLILGACSGDPVQKDLLNYVNTELPKVASLETEAVDAYASVSGENYSTDSAMYYTIKQTVLPKYEEFNTKLNTIQPSTPEVKAMHQEYINAAGDQMEAFKLICLASTVPAFSSITYLAGNFGQNTLTNELSDDAFLTI